VRPNGIALSPDQNYLYVNDTLRKIIMRYDVQPDDSAEWKIITDMNSDTAPELPTE